MSDEFNLVTKPEWLKVGNHIFDKNKVVRLERSPSGTLELYFMGGAILRPSNIESEVIWQLFITSAEDLLNESGGEQTEVAKETKAK